MLHATYLSSEYPYFELDSESSTSESDRPLLYDTPPSSPPPHSYRIRFSEPTLKRRMGFKKWFSRSKNDRRPLIDRITTPMDEILTDDPPTTTDALTSPPRARKYRDQQREEYERRQQYERREREMDRYSVPRKHVQDSARWHEHVRQQPHQQHQPQHHQISQQQIPQHHQHQIPHIPNVTLASHMHQAYLNPRQLSQAPRAMSGYHNQSLLRPMSQVLDPRYFRTEGYPVPPVTYAQIPQSMQAEIVELKEEEDKKEKKKEEKKEEKKEKEEKPEKTDKKKDKKEESQIDKLVKQALQNHRPAVYETLVRMNSYVLSVKLAICIVCVAFYPLFGGLLFVVLFGSEILLELAIKCGPDK